MAFQAEGPACQAGYQTGNQKSDEATDTTVIRPTFGRRDKPQTLADLWYAERFGETIDALERKAE